MEKETKNVTGLENEDALKEEVKEPVEEVKEPVEEKEVTSDESKTPVEENASKEEENASKEELEALRKEVASLRENHKKGTNNLFLKLLAMVAGFVIAIAITESVLSYREKQDILSNIADNEIYDTLEECKEEGYVDDVRSSVDSYYDKAMSSNAYGEAMTSSGSTYGVCYSKDGEMMYTDTNSFVYFEDKNKDTYAIGTDSNGQFVTKDMKQFNPVEFMRFFVDGNYGKEYYVTGEEESGNMYWSMSDKEFKEIFNEFNTQYCKGNLDFDSFRQIIGMTSKQSKEPHNMIVGIGAYETGVILDIIYVGEESYTALYEVTMFDNIPDWSLGEEWYKDGADKLKIASDKMVEVLGYLGDLYNKYNESVSDNSVSEDAVE